jgi:hypothetical protein
MSNHVGVSIEDHVIAFSIWNVNILLTLFFQVGGFQLDMMVIVVDAENTFKKRL